MLSSFQLSLDSDFTSATSQQQPFTSEGIADCFTLALQLLFVCTLLKPRCPVSTFVFSVTFMFFGQRTVKPLGVVAA